MTSKCALGIAFTDTTAWEKAALTKHQSLINQYILFKNYKSCSITNYLNNDASQSHAFYFEK